MSGASSIIPGSYEIQREVTQNGDVRYAIYFVPPHWNPYTSKPLPEFALHVPTREDAEQYVAYVNSWWPDETDAS